MGTQMYFHHKYEEQLLVSLFIIVYKGFKLFDLQLYIYVICINLQVFDGKQYLKYRLLCEL